MVWNTGRKRTVKKQVPKQFRKSKGLGLRKGLRGIGKATGIDGADEIHQVQRAVLRSAIVFTIGLGWFILTPFIFLDGGLLYGFGYYQQLIANQGVTTYQVYQFWTLVPEIVLFLFGIFWSGGLLDKIVEMLHF